MSTFVDLNRASYLKSSVSVDRLNFLSAQYKNIRFLLPASRRYVVDMSDTANAPGIAYRLYGDKGYWWVICQYAGILNPITAFQPGTILYLPTLADINTFLTSQTDSAETTVTI